MCQNKGLALSLQEWTREAFEQCGGDWQKISDHIRFRMANLSPEEQKRFNAEIAITLSGADQISSGDLRRN
jgi:hypothetical protein